MPAPRERPQLASEIARDAFGMLRADWRNQALTLLGVVWGAAAVVLLLAFGSGLYRFFDIGFKKTGDRHTVAYGTYTSTEHGGARPGRAIRLDWDDYERARVSIGSARRVAAEYQRGGIAARTASLTKTSTVSAGTPDVRHIKVLEVARGRFYDETDVAAIRPVAVLGHSVATEWFEDIDPIGREIQIEGRPLRVIGVLARKGSQIVINNALHDDMIFIPLTQGQRIFGLDDAVGSLLLEPHRIDDTPALRDELRALLWPAHRLADDESEAVNMFSTSDYTAGLRFMAVALDILLGGIGTVILAMAAVGVANLMVAQVHRRRVELGLRRALGARRRHIMGQLLLETLVVVFSGGLVGVAGAGALVAIVSVLPLPDMVPPPNIAASVWITAFVALVVSGLVAGIAPARRAALIEPSAALRSS